jgi:MFS family permease
MLIAARALQGTAGSALMQLVFITISDLFSIRHRPLYNSLLSFVWVVAGTSGPLIGGAFTQLVNWRWCFWINLPVCGLAFILLLLFLDVHNPRTKLSDGLMAIDWFGTFSILAGTLLVLLGLDFGGAIFPWNSPKVFCLIVVGSLMFVFFFYSEKRLAKYPLIPITVFNNRSNNAAFLVAITQNMVAIGQEYYLPLYFQSVKLASPLKSGILIIPTMITEAAADMLAGIIIHRTGRYRELAWFGVTLMTLGIGLYITFDTDTTIATIIGLQIVAGIGTALVYQIPTIAIQNSVSQADTASAIATLGTVGNIATAFSVVVGGVIFQNSIAARQSTFKGLNATLLDAFSPAHAAANVDLIRTLPDPRLVQEAFSWSIRNMFIFYTGIAAVSIAASLFMKQKHMSSNHTETKTGIANLTKSEKFSQSLEVK